MTDGKALRRFFDDRLMPVARGLKEQGIATLEAERVPGAATYYRRRLRPAMSAQDFRWGGAQDGERLEADLRALWGQPGEEALAGLAPEMARLAASLRRPDEQPAEVSDFIYVMY